MVSCQPLLCLAATMGIVATGCSRESSSNQGTAEKAWQGNGLAVEIRPGSGAYAVRGQNSVVIRFRNVGTEAISILKPLDGSTECWHMPYYRFTITDRNGKALKPALRCGNSGLWADTQWPTDYLVEIKPGASFDTEVCLPCEVERDGPHTIAFEYVYQPKNEQFVPPDRAWRGSLKSAEGVLDLKR